MAAVKVASFIITDNALTTDAVIAAGINITSTVFDIAVIPISNTQSRVIIFYN
jgi:hypothetical protein